MTISEVNGKVKELREPRQMADELQAEIEALQDSFKDEMTAQGADVLLAPTGKKAGKRSKADV